MCVSRRSNCAGKRRRLAIYIFPKAFLTIHTLQLREIELRVQREINEKRQELLAKEESLRWVVVTLPCPVVMAVGRPTRSCLLMSSCVTGISRVDWPRKVHRQISASKPLFQNPILCACRDAKIPPNCWSRIDRRTLLFCCRVTPSLPLGFTSDNRFLRLFFFVHENKSVVVPISFGRFSALLNQISVRGGFPLGSSLYRLACHSFTSFPITYA